jgi:hypothetical protein
VSSVLGAGGMRVGVVGPGGPDRFADNIGDALRRTGHVVTQLGPARPHAQGGLAGSLKLAARQAVPRLDERAQRRIVRNALEAGCQVVINIDARLMPSAVAQLKQAGRLSQKAPNAECNRLVSMRSTLGCFASQAENVILKRDVRITVPSTTGQATQRCVVLQGQSTWLRPARQFE